MSLLLSANGLSKSFGSRVLFKDLSLSVFGKNRLGLIGPNGTGKSTLLKILCDIESSDSGAVTTKKELRIGYVPQTSEFSDASPLEILKKAQNAGSNLPDYEKEQLAKVWLTKLQFRDDALSAAKLSGGWKKRLSFAKALVCSPDLLLLDEPTNHLDLEGILWLEQFLLKEAATYVLVSHDRYFLQTVTNRIVEVDPVYPTGLFEVEGSYEDFLQKKGEFLEAQLNQQRSLASKARRESQWLAQSPKARTTKAQSRIETANQVLDDLQEVKSRNQTQRASIQFDASQRQTKKLLIAKNLAKAAGDKELFEHLDFTLNPGTRIGLMGPNGAGKTTLLRLLAGELTPDSGTIKKADELKIVYFDQHRALLPDHVLLKDALCPSGDFVLFRGKRVHINGWCKRFLFTPDLLSMPLGKLSGGERARISIAHLMLQPADLLLLDEPTNDLDVATLETLEQSLVDFPGAVVLITHDRCMLDRICNTLLALGDSNQPEFYADYSQWESARLPKPVSQKKVKKPKVVKEALSFEEKKECQQIEKKISKFEKEVHDLNLLLEDVKIAENPKQLDEICKAIGLAENEIEQLYVRWMVLDQKKRASALDD